MTTTLNANDMVECPYNVAHRMLRKRLQSHLIKCRQSYPDVELQKCPFNQTHLIPEPEFVHHVTNCSDRKLITQYKYDAPITNEEERVKHEPIECEDNWDDTDAVDYNPQKYLEQAKVLRKIDGGQPAERKALVKLERKRLGDYDSSEDEKEENAKMRKFDLDRPHSSDDEDNYVYESAAEEQGPPPAPSNVNWRRDVQGRSHVSLQQKERAPDREYPIRRDTYSNQERNEHPLDDDPYYSASGSRNSSYSSNEQSNFSGRGSYRGNSYLGQQRGRYARPYYEY